MCALVKESQFRGIGNLEAGMSSQVQCQCASGKSSELWLGHQGAAFGRGWWVWWQLVADMCLYSGLQALLSLPEALVLGRDSHRFAQLSRPGPLSEVLGVVTGVRSVCHCLGITLFDRYAGWRPPDRGRMHTIS